MRRRFQAPTAANAPAPLLAEPASRKLLVTPNGRTHSVIPVTRGGAFVLVVVATAALATSPTLAQTSVVGWGATRVDSALNQGPFVQIAAAGLYYGQVAAGGFHSAAILSDGSVVTWGSNNLRSRERPAPPPRDHLRTA
jgi:hypothetical protein